MKIIEKLTIKRGNKDNNIYKSSGEGLDYIFQHVQECVNIDFLN